MKPPALLPHERQIIEDFVERYRNSQAFGAENEWLFDLMVDQIPTRPEDDCAQSGWVYATRIFALQAISARCLATAAGQRAILRAWAQETAPQVHIDAVAWLSAFEVLGFATDPDEPLERPTQPTRLWRGSTPQHMRGLAWTGSLDVAHRFVRERTEEGLVATVFTLVSDPERVWARYNLHDEDEWVLDPKGLHIAKWSDGI